ncbi:hypothetical protein Q5691_12070 [Microcoleus sp. w1-18aA5]
MPSWCVLSAIAQEFNKSVGAFTPTYFPSKPALNHHASGVISS